MTVDSKSLDLLSSRTAALSNEHGVFVQKISQNIVSNARIAVLSLTSTKNSRKNSKGKNETVEENIRKIFQPTQIMSFFGLSQLSQNTGFLLSFLYDRADIFVHILKLNQKKPIFTHLVQLVIPSFFGFFSSYEHLENAFKFYRTVIETLDKETAKTVLKPFFLSAPLFRFVEATLDGIIDKLVFYIFSNPNFHFDDTVDYYTDLLFEAIKETSKLIPIQYKHLISYIKEKEWNFNDKWNIIWTKSFLKLFTLYIDYSPLSSYMDYFKAIFDKISDRKEEIIDILSDTNSCFIVPSICPPGQNPILLAYVCLDDIITVAKLVDQEKMMPDSLSIDEFGNIPQIHYNSYFWCIIYPRFPSKNTSIKRFDTNTPLIDESILNLSVLEKYITLELSYRDLYQWNNIIDSEMSLLTYNCVQTYINDIKMNQNKNSDPFALSKFEQSYEKITFLFTTNEEKKIAYLMILNEFIQKVRITNDVMLDQLDIEWVKYLNRRPMEKDELNFLDFVDIMLKDKMDQNIFFDAIKKLRCVDCLGILHKFNIMEKAFGEVMKISNNNISYFTQLIIQANPKTFMSTIILIGCLAVKNPFFAELCTIEEMKSWEMADYAWRALMKPDEVLTCAVRDYSLFLMEQFVPEQMQQRIIQPRSKSLRGPRKRFITF